MKHALPLAALFALVACGSTPAENSADRLEDAAEQSTPEAAAVLENEAEAIDQGNAAASDAQAQEALQNAGEAQGGNSQ